VISSRNLAAAAVLLVALTGCAPAAELTAPPVTTLGQQNEEIVADIVACLNDEGWQVELDALTDSFEYVGPEEQLDAFRAAREACREQVTAGMTFPPLDDEQLAEIYEYEKWTAECLRVEGVEVPAIPSLQEFSERYRSSDPWLAYNYLGNVGESTFRAMLEKCPQL
jgi:uncharacterized protein YqgV (UPF0045/DUF77 family)